jgi:hypothetical protein
MQMLIAHCTDIGRIAHHHRWRSVADSSAHTGAIMAKTNRPTKSVRKATAAAILDKNAYQETPFGRRRVTRMPNSIAYVARLLGKIVH